MSHEGDGTGRDSRKERRSPPAWAVAEYEVEIGVGIDGKPIEGETLDDAVIRARDLMEKGGGRSFKVYRIGEKGKMTPVAYEQRTKGYTRKSDTGEGGE